MKDMIVVDFNGLLKSVSSGAHCVLSVSVRYGTSNQARFMNCVKIALILAHKE